MDVKTAYLNAPLDYKIYADPPKALKIKVRIMFNNFKKSLNGLKQSGWTRNKTFHTYLITQFHAIACGPLYVLSKCQQSNIHHFIMGR